MSQSWEPVILHMLEAQRQADSACLVDEIWAWEAVDHGDAAVVNQQNKARYLRLIFDLLEASAPTVVYEAASSLTSLTNNPVAVKAAASKFIELAIKESDNNVKLIVLDRVDQLRQKNEGILDDVLASAQSKADSSAQSKKTPTRGRGRGTHHAGGGRHSLRRGSGTLGWHPQLRRCPARGVC